jgi:hypothetical protein
MAGTATPLRLSPSRVDLGKFNAKAFSIMNADELMEYQELRTKANDTSLGIKIERMQQLSRKTVVVSGDGPDRTTTTSEEVLIFVEWWEKKPVPAQGGNDAEEVQELRQLERPAGA